jgi:hypothetical protein
MRIFSGLMRQPLRPSARAERGGATILDLPEPRPHPTSAADSRNDWAFRVVAREFDRDKLSGPRATSQIRWRARVGASRSRSKAAARTASNPPFAPVTAAAEHDLTPSNVPARIVRRSVRPRESSTSHSLSPLHWKLPRACPLHHREHHCRDPRPSAPSGTPCSKGFHTRCSARLHPAVVVVLPHPAGLIARGRRSPWVPVGAPSVGTPSRVRR